PPPGLRKVPCTLYPSADCENCVIGSLSVGVMSVRATMSTVTDFTTSLYAAFSSIIWSMSLPTRCASSLNLFDTTGRSPSARSVSSGVIGRQSLVMSSIVAKGSILSPPSFKGFRNRFNNHRFCVFFVDFNIMFFGKFNQLSFCHFFKVNFFFDVFFFSFLFLFKSFGFFLCYFYPILSKNFKGAINDSPRFSVFVFQLTSPLNPLLPLAQRCTMMLLPVSAALIRIYEQ